MAIDCEADLDLGNVVVCVLVFVFVNDTDPLCERTDESDPVVDGDNVGENVLLALTSEL